jgi:hypothetical protein
MMAAIHHGQVFLNDASGEFNNVETDKIANK